MTAPASSEFAQASVFDGQSETRYRRAGRGPAVVVLSASHWVAAPAILKLLAQGFRLIVPALDAWTGTSPVDAGSARAEFAPWLASFLDGLGLAAVSLVADERFAAAAMGFALAEPDRVQRLAVVMDGAVQRLAPELLAEPLRHAAPRVFVSWLDADPGATARDVRRFLQPVLATD